MTSTRPNILILVSHDSGKHIAPYGIDTVHTPNFERLAAEGVLLRHHFCTAPQCSPARASIFTGRLPHATGVMGLTHADFAWRMFPGERHLSRLLHQAGYRTARFGFCHETSAASQDELLCFDHVAPGNGILDQAEALGAFLAQRDPARPFYAQFQCFETHRDFLAHGVEPDDARGVHLPARIPDAPSARADYAAFQGALRRLDQGLGAILDRLATAGVLDDTIVVVTTDHGAAMPWAKGTLYDAGIDAFCQLRHPHWGAGRRYHQLTSHVDLVPTLLEACGLVPGDRLHGRSLLPWLRGGADRPVEAIHAGKTFHDCYDPQRCVRTLRWKYIRYFEKSALHRFTGDTIRAGGASAAIPLESLARERADELYDLEADPGEECNLAASGDHQAVRRELAGRLLATMERTADPLLHGAIASPFWTASLGELRTLAAEA